MGVCFCLLSLFIGAASAREAENRGGATREPEVCGPNFVPVALGQAQSTSLTTCSLLIEAGYGVV